MGEEQRRQHEQKQRATLSSQEHIDEDNERAKDLEDKAKRIDLGKNLEQRLDKKAPKQREAKDKKNMASRPQAGDGLQVSNAITSQEHAESSDLPMPHVASQE